MPSRLDRSRQARPVFKGVACRGCQRSVLTVVLATDHHLYLRCDHCGQPLAIPQRRNPVPLAEQDQNDQPAVHTNARPR